MRPRRNVGLRTRLRCVLKICPMLYTCAFAKVTRVKGYDGRCVLLVDIVNGTVSPSGAGTAAVVGPRGTARAVVTGTGPVVSASPSAK